MEQERISVDRIDELVHLVFLELKRLGGRGRPKDVLAAVEQAAHLSEYEQQRTQTGAVRWDTHLRFYTTDCVKAGYLNYDGSRPAYFPLATALQQGSRTSPGVIAADPGALSRAHGRLIPSHVAMETLTAEYWVSQTILVF